jgi:hypothetical protein
MGHDLATAHIEQITALTQQIKGCLGAHDIHIRCDRILDELDLLLEAITPPPKSRLDELEEM